MKRLSIYIVVLLGVVKPLSSQDQHYMDSLSAYLTKPDDSLKLLAISDLAWEYNTSDVQKAIALSFKGVEIAGKLKRPYALGQAYSDLGTSYYYKRDFDSSAYFYEKAEAITKVIGDSIELASLYNKMGALYKERAEFNTSLKYSFASLKIYQAKNLSKKIALLYNNIGTTYEMLKNYTLAGDYYKKALTINHAENSKGGMGRNYMGLGNISTTTKDYREALDYYHKAELIFNELGWGIELSAVLNNIGNIYDEQKKYPESLAKRTEALQIAVDMEDKQEQAKFHNYIADVLMKMKRFREADLHIKQAGTLIRDVESNELRMDLYEVSSKYYFGTGNYEMGNEYLLKFHDLKDSVYSKDLSENVAVMEVRHNVQKLRLEKAEAEAANLKLSNDKLAATQQRNLILTLCICILVAGGFGIYFYNVRKKRAEEKIRISAVLESEEKERARIARELHDGLGQLLSTARLNAAALEDSVEQEDEPILKTTLQLIDQSVSELRAISHNLMPRALSDKGLIEALTELVNQINTGKTIQVDLKHDPLRGMRKPLEIALYRMIQEVLNNMIRHAGASVITLKLQQEQTQLTVRISDNGKGFDTALIENSAGIGWKNIATRLSLINGTFDISSAAGQGTYVEMKIKL